MTDPIRFLNAFGKSLSAMALYGPTHPARAKSAQLAFETVQQLQRSELVLKFSFLGDEVVFQNRHLRELRDWEWCERFTRSGIQRMEFVCEVIREEFDDFLYTIMAEVTPGWRDPRHTQRHEGSEYTSIKYGAIGVRGDAEQFLTDPLPVMGMNFPLDEEAETIGMIYGEVEAGRPLPAGEIEAVVASLSVAMHGDSEILMPLLQLKEFDQYTTAHALNVSVLVMGLSEFLGLGSRDTRAIGVAGLLRDVGMTKVPKDIVSKAGPPTDDEWDVIRQHPVEGARIILMSEPQLDVAAVVAYEHHMLPGGQGYPTPHFERECHYASKLVQVCDCYDALRTRRFHRGAWTPESALRYVEDKAGTVFDAEIAKAFVTMMRRWERRIIPLEEGQPLQARPASEQLPVPAHASLMTPRGTPIVRT
ncbi:MAG TPA: HD domain-containing phosphohydrolase [Gemmatimonadaceae bacterium]|nr:HD domain-containing phosphohydrolase [Gemmatimonadaceae bacterium]